MDKVFTGSTHPKNSVNTLYIYCGMAGTYQQNLGLAIEKAKRHFGMDINFLDLAITSGHIRTRQMHDEYHSEDYDNYIIITRR